MTDYSKMVKDLGPENADTFIERFRRDFNTFDQQEQDKFFDCLAKDHHLLMTTGERLSAKDMRHRQFNYFLDAAVLMLKQRDAS